MPRNKIVRTISLFHLPVKGDSLAQQVEHIPFKDGVLGSNPKRVTNGTDRITTDADGITIKVKENRQEILDKYIGDFSKATQKGFIFNNLHTFLSVP